MKRKNLLNFLKRIKISKCKIEKTSKKAKMEKEESMETKFYSKDKLLVFKITEEIDDDSVQ